MRVIADEAQRLSVARRIALAALVLVVVAGVLLLLFRRPDEHEYTLLFQNAGQLVKDDDVQVGGRRVGSVKTIELTDDNQAADHDRGRGAATRRCTRARQAIIRATSLSGIANRYVSLTPGPEATAAARRQGDADAPTTTTTIVDLDQLFNTLDPQTRAASRRSSRASPRSTTGKGDRGQRRRPKYFNPRAVDLAPARRRSSPRTTAALDRASLVQAPRTRDGRSRAARRPHRPRHQHERRRRRRSPPRTRRSTRALELLPTTLRRGEHDVREPARDARRPRRAGRRVQARDQGPRPVPAPSCARSSRDARPTIRDLRRLVSRHGPNNDLVDATLKLPAPAARRDARRSAHGRQALDARQPVLEFFRPYAPDFVGWLRDFGQGAANYDANGHFARIAADLQRLLATAPTRRAACSTPIPRRRSASTGSTRGNAERCPGAATQAPADGSATVPRQQRHACDCDPTLRLPGP